jgi:hypothetical protein
MQLGSMFISNCSVRASKVDGFCRSHRPWTLLLDTSPISCQTPEAVTTVFKCSWGWTQIASETCRVLLQLIINNTAKLHHVGSLYILTYDARKIKHKKRLFRYWGWSNLNSYISFVLVLKERMRHHTSSLNPLRLLYTHICLNFFLLETY